MKILLIVSLLVIITTLFPVGILFSLLAKKLSQSKKNLWHYCKALLLISLAVFLSVYIVSFFFWGTFHSMALMFLLFFLITVLIISFYQKSWHNYEKIATTSWGLIVFLGIILLSTNFSLLSPFIISDTGMAPAYSKGDLVFCQLNKALTFGYSKGDVVVFRDPSDKKKTLIRKIIATKGDSVKINGGQLFVNEQLIRKVHSNELITPITLENGQYFVLAENSENNYDSKVFGPITKTAIYIKILFKLNWLKN